MINFKTITKALEDQLKAANAENKAYTITRNKSQNQNDSVAVAGWIGIYRDSQNVTPHSTGATPWMNEAKIRIEIQAASMNSEEECEEKLDELIKFVADSLNAGRKNISGTVGIITEIDVEYDDNYDTDMQTSYQFATMTVTAEVKA